VLLLDALKGLIPVAIASSAFALQGAALALVLLAACLGHAFPIFFKFNGGKGIATLFGALMGLNLVLTILLGLIWIGTALLSRYASLASLTVIILTPFIMLIDNANFFIPLLLTALLLTWNHRGNIKRLRQGKESQIGE
jgi:glycerol-3-phosphate acyltransferase PlsY